MIAGVNLLPSYHREVRRRRVETARWVAICIGYAMVVSAAGLAVQMVWAQGHDRVAAQLAQVNQQIQLDKETIAKLGPKLGQLQTTLAASQTVGMQPDWSVLMKLVAGLLDDKTVLAGCRLAPASEVGGSTVLGAASKAKKASGDRPAGYVLQLRGLGQNQQAIAGYVLRLQKTGLFSKVTLIDTHKEPFLRGGDHAIGFQIRCDLGNGSEGGHG